MVESCDVAIAGGGASGLALALALHGASAGALNVIIFDRALAAPLRDDARALAIVAGARRFLEGIGVWPALEPVSQPILGMDITDSGLTDPIRPVILSFDSEMGSSGPFAHMTPAAAIVQASLDRLARTNVRIVHERIIPLDATGSRLRLAAGAKRFNASLVVAADGKASPLRAAAGIPFYGWSYGQTGIVATIGHSLPHEGRAIEHFLPSGPFALLPLRGQESSIVWTEEAKAAERYLASSEDDLREQIDRRAGGRFGTVTSVRNVAGFPLSLGIARRFAGERLALLGDAAHVMHPIAGQGLNYGLRGAAALAEAIIGAARLGLDIGSPEVLQRYETSRRSDVVRMALATDGLNRLFSNDIGPVRLLRDFGLGVVERATAMKEWFIGEAAGESRFAPAAFRNGAG
jgi:2-octaprenyl-6-methoxyphenol hydroxylase